MQSSQQKQFLKYGLLLLLILLGLGWLFLGPIPIAGTLLVLTGVTFVLRPSFPLEYFSSVTEQSLFNWLTPTLGDFLTVTFGWQHADFMGIIILPLMIVWWWFKRSKINFNEPLQITLVISMITAPFGWGYDAIVLIIPILQVVVWIVDKSYTKTVSILHIAGIILIDAFAFYHRTVMQNEVEVFWIPLAIGAVYFAARTLKYKLPTSSTTLVSDQQYVIWLKGRLLEARSPIPKRSTYSANGYLKQSKTTQFSPLPLILTKLLANHNGSQRQSINDSIFGLDDQARRWVGDVIHAHDKGVFACR